MHSHNLNIIVLLVFALSISMGASNANANAPDDIVIIANKSLKVESISAADAKRIFLKEKTSLNGVKIIPINARSGSNLRKTFAQKVLGKSMAEENNYWQEQKVKSGLQKPTELSNTVRAIFSLKNGISYCYRKDFNPATAKILLSL